VFTIHDCSRFVDGLDHPEAVAVSPDGSVFAGGEAGQVYRMPSDGSSVVELAHVTGFVAGVALDGAGNLYVCDVGGSRVARVRPDGTVETYTEDFQFTYPNFGAFDPAGNLYLTDSGDYYRADGKLVVVRPGGRVEVLIPGYLHYPNGLAIDPEGRYLYLAQSTAHNILRFPLGGGGPGHAEIGDAEIYVTLPGMVPDGLALAASGNLYVGCYTPDVILKVTPGRVVKTVVADPGSDLLNRPTNLAFTGSTLLYANLGGYHIGAIDVGEPGAPLHYPEL
jgi:gluconolactonase